MLKNCLLRASVIAFAGLVISFISACAGSRPIQPANSSQPASDGKAASANSCSLLSETEIAGVAGNPVNKGRNEASTEVCKWDTDDPRDIDVLLIVREKGSTREKILCDDVRNNNGAEHVSDLGDVAVWKFSSAGGLFNTGDLEVCGSKGYLNITLQGQRDEAALKAATVNLTQKILQRL